MEELENTLYSNFNEFKKTLATTSQTFPNINDFEKKMLGKGYIMLQTSDFLSAIIYFSMALWSYAITKKDNDSVKILQTIIIQTRQKFKNSLMSDTGSEDTPSYSPEKESDMINKLTGAVLNFETMAGATREKSMVMNKFIYPLKYNFLYLTEENNVLLYGPPGTGKTLLAKSSVGELNKDPNFKFLFYNLSADAVRSKWEGGTEKNIANMFKEASNEAIKQQSEMVSKGNPNAVVKSVLFLDEVEAIAKSREQGGEERAVTTLLQQMDGFKSSGNVLVMAATNFPWTLDSAFLRRFTSRVFVDLPDFIARVEVLADTLFSKYNKKSSKDLNRLLTLFVANTGASFSTALGNYVFETKGEQSKQVGQYIDSLYQQIGNLFNFRDEVDYFSKYACILGNKIKNIFSNANATIPNESKWLSSQGTNLKVLAKFLFFIADITGPSSTLLSDPSPIKGMNKRTSKLARSKYGYSPSDLVKIVSEFFSITARNIINACYEEATGKDKCTTDDAVQPVDNCYKKLIDQGALKPCPDTGRFVFIQRPPSSLKKFVDASGRDEYTIFIPELFEEALNVYPTTVGNSDVYCNFIQYEQGDPKPSLDTECAKIQIPKR